MVMKKHMGTFTSVLPPLMAFIALNKLKTLLLPGAESNITPFIWKIEEKSCELTTTVTIEYGISSMELRLRPSHSNQTGHGGRGGAQ